MTLLKYQGAALTSGLPGDTVVWSGILWTITDQGHLVSDVAEDNPAAVELIESGTVSIQGA